MKIDRIDKVILITPFLTVFDILSTFYALSLGHKEVGLFVSHFARAGVLHLYPFVYFLGFFGTAFFLYKSRYIMYKRGPSMSESAFRFVLTFHLGAVVFIPGHIAKTSVSNSLLSIFSNPFVQQMIRLITYFIVAILILQYTKSWITEHKLPRSILSLFIMCFWFFSELVYL